jgi:hypothetical protein
MYNGKTVQLPCAEFSFKGEKNETWDDFEFCVTTEYFRDVNCAVRLDYKSSESSESVRVSHCRFKTLWVLTQLSDQRKSLVSTSRL